MLFSVDSMASTCVEGKLSVVTPTGSGPLEMLSTLQFPGFLLLPQKESSEKMNPLSLVRWWVVQIRLNKNHAWIIIFSLLCWCKLSNPPCRPLMSLFIVLQSCRKLKGKIWAALAKGRRGGGREWRAPRQGFLGHGTRKWTRLAWPAGARSQECEETQSREARAVVLENTRSNKWSPPSLKRLGARNQV